MTRSSSNSSQCLPWLNSTRSHYSLGFLFAISNFSARNPILPPKKQANLILYFTPLGRSVILFKSPIVISLYLSFHCFQDTVTPCKRMFARFIIFPIFIYSMYQITFLFLACLTPLGVVPGPKLKR